MNFNERLRQKMAEKGDEAAKKWQKKLEDDSLEFDHNEYQKAEEVVSDWRKKRQENNL